MAKTQSSILGKFITVDDLFAIAEHAGKLSKIIRDWLPVAGDLVAKTSNPRTAANRFETAAEYYENCERIRNPENVPFAGSGYVMQRGYSSGVYSKAFDDWQELLTTLDELAVLYSWQGISDRTALHGWNWWGEVPIPSADPDTLDRLDRTIAGLKAVAAEIKIDTLENSSEALTETPPIPPAAKRYSKFREPQEWLRLRKLKGLSNHRNTWQALLKKHGDDIDCESTKSARISFELDQDWGLKLPEFETIRD